MWYNCYYSKRLLDKFLSLNERAKNKVDLDKVTKAIHSTKEYHGDQKRHQVSHINPLEVAYSNMTRNVPNGVL